MIVNAKKEEGWSEKEGDKTSRSWRNRRSTAEVRMRLEVEVDAWADRKVAMERATKPLRQEVADKYELKVPWSGDPWRRERK